MKIIIADDHSMFRELLSTILINKFPKCHIIEAVDYHSTLIACDAHRPTLLFLDIVMPNMLGLQSVVSLVNAFPAIKIIVCSAHDNLTLIKTLRSVSVYGYVSKIKSSCEIISAMDAVLDKQYFFPMLKDTEQIVPLTPRQIEIIGMLCAGLSNKEIAFRLNISLHTVKFHVSLLLKKLGAKNRQEAISAISTL